LSRFPSAVRMNAPLRVPTRTRTLLMRNSFAGRDVTIDFIRFREYEIDHAFAR
jgi:hypothetical protein